MKRLSLLLVSLFVASTFVFAHEGNEHVRGVVTQVSPQSITLQTTDKKTRTLTLTAKTTAKAAPAAKLDIAFLARPAKTGENTFEVLVKDAAGKPVTDADVSVGLFMPAMPAMKMPEMRNS